MITITELRKRAKAKLKDAEQLFKCKRYDGAVYLCGYSLELALKSRTCKTLGWLGFPENNREFENVKSFKTHNLDVLLSLSGFEKKIKLHFISDWSIVNQWNPEMRYNSIGSINSIEAKNMIDSTKNLLRQI